MGAIQTGIFVEAKDIQWHTVAFFFLCQNVKTVCTKGIQVQRFSPEINSLYAEHHRDVVLRKHADCQSKMRTISGMSYNAKTVALQMKLLPQRPY